MKIYHFLKKKCDNWHCMHDITPDMVYEIYRNKVKAHG